jgi:hypothetical protein
VTNQRFHAACTHDRIGAQRNQGHHSQVGLSDIEIKAQPVDLAQCFAAHLPVL